MRLPILPLLIMLLAGCALHGPERTNDWQRADTTPDETAGDLHACRHRAEQQAGQDQKIDQDMGADPTSQGDLITNLDQYQTEKRVNEMIHACMQALGYSPAGPAAN